MSTAGHVEHLIIGGGFYGCCLALFLRSVSRSVLLVEANSDILDRASRVNQARVHTGFHYPRSTLTAVKSLALHRRFATDFPDAIRQDFHMLYAIARHRSRVSANRFFQMFSSLDAPLRRADTHHRSLFSNERIEDVFLCNEAAFDYSILRRHLWERLSNSDTDVRVGVSVTGLSEGPHAVTVTLSSGEVVEADSVYNVTYASTNKLLATAGLPLAPLKYELAEVALVLPPPSLKSLGITVMDGPFFSTMPYPAANLHSLTHVRYTPHISWTDDSATCAPALAGREDRARHMLLDSARYLPSIVDATWQRSLWEVKAVLLRNESDDGRPILYQRLPQNSRITSILGGKMDNVYDLFDAIREKRPELAQAHDGLVHGRRDSLLMESGR